MSVASEPAPEAGILVDPVYCMSSFLALRHVYREGVAWAPGVVPVLERRDATTLRPVGSADEMSAAIGERLRGLNAKTTGLLLSGGMDSAILASYLPPGTRAFTFRFLDTAIESEAEQAARFAQLCGLDLIEVPLGPADYLDPLPELMANRNAPVHSIEPQLLKALRAARSHGITQVVSGENADATFGGLDGMLAEDWELDAFIERFAYVDPTRVLVEHADYRDAFVASRRGTGVDQHHFMSVTFADESLNSYGNAADVAGVELILPFAELTIDGPIDLARIRKGDSKYLVRELFRSRFPEEPMPPKRPMPRAVASLLADWPGPRRPEFVPGAAEGLRPDQRWMLFVLEAYLDSIDGA